VGSTLYCIGGKTEDVASCGCVGFPLSKHVYWLDLNTLRWQKGKCNSKAHMQLVEANVHLEGKPLVVQTDSDAKQLFSVYDMKDALHAPDDSLVLHAFSNDDECLDVPQACDKATFHWDF
jgi:hypothetical protein